MASNITWIFLTGAYQEVMGNHHNLFGDPNEAHIEILPTARIVSRSNRRSCIRDMVAFARYDATTLADDYRKLLQARSRLLGRNQRRRCRSTGRKILSGCPDEHVSQ